MNRIKFYQVPITPFIAILVPLFYLAEANIIQINFDDISRSLWILVVAGGVLLLAGRLIFRSGSKSAVFGTLVVFLFFSYGHFYSVFEKEHLFLGHHKVLLLLNGLILLLAAVWLFRTQCDLTSLVGTLNIISCALLLYSAVPACIQFYQYDHAKIARREKIREMEAAGEGSQFKPDIYFIILDMYARDDVLQEIYHYDNTAFLSDLQKMGFYTVDCSQSNYQQTMISLISTLNYEYLQDTPGDHPEETSFPYVNQRTREDMVNNKARILLESKGYKTVAFETGYGFSEWNDADVYYSLDNARGPLNDFETMFTNTTMALAYNEYRGTIPKTAEKIDWETYDESPEYRYKIKSNALRNLDLITDVPGPKFVFAHIALPHGPFVFTATGAYTGGKLNETEGYIPQLIYTNQRITRILQQIIANSDVPPIIILESDHGIDETNPNIRMKNLMAYYGPEDMKTMLYPTITPVNSFRVVFNSLGYTDLPLLPDYSFYSPDFGKYPFSQVPNHCTPETKGK